MNFFENLWDLMWWSIGLYVFLGCLFAVFTVIGDIFRDHDLNGWAKAGWLVVLVLVPFLTVLVYLIARGEGLTRRSMASKRQYQAAHEAYIRSVATLSPSDEITKAKGLLDAGTITPTEFDSIKAKVAV
ncbi:SHOCT domain-containing protein [Arthrobacter sp. B0490]|uniref:SHOCT domain-containing protein n=1 Tax=Arthrobacter sp. B0490 TaxID=2058891 RepID=UPI000CE4A1FA|nr:SHOCT domain-containing protein [Arthrobacter sp. B0490]